MSEMLDFRHGPGLSEPRYVNTDALVWVHRAMLECGGLAGLFQGGRCCDDELAEVLGLDDLIDFREDVDLAAVRERLREGLQRLEAEYESDPGVIGANLDLLVASLGLNDTERALVHFAAALQVFGWMLDGLRHMRVSGVGSAAAANVLATLLARPANEVRFALRPQGILRAAGLFNQEDKGATNLFRMLNLLDGLADRLYGDAHKDVHSLLQGLFDDAQPPSLGPEDFEHIRQDYQMVHTFLAEAVKRGTTGVNILLHGEPGVGKTELVRTLCQALGLQLYEVAGGDSGGERRVQMFLFAESVLRQRNDCVILFDEIEDVFPVPDFFGRPRGALSKASMNRLLEQNPIPAFWLANEIGHIDSAYLRRFDLVIEVRKPGREARERVVTRYFGDGQLAPSTRQALLKNDDLSPASIERAARVADHLAADEQRDTAVLRVLRHNQRGMRLRPPQLAPSVRLPYVPEAINTSLVAETLARGLATGSVARMLLHGPPGTGKTEWARRLAERLDKPLMAKRYSEIESAYIGECEKNIARMFEEAADRDAVLLFDEADSLLRTRALAHRGWERTRVNEMLAQMEVYPGIFIATTNTLDELDEAAMRRFDFKVRFDYLTHEQACLLANAFLRSEGKQELGLAERERLSSLRVAPGDFAVLARKLQVCGGVLSAEMLVDELESEVAYRVMAQTAERRVAH